MSHARIPYTFIISVLIGVLASIIIPNSQYFFGGVGFPFLITLILLGFFAMVHLAKYQLNRRNLWLLAPIGFFSMMNVLRADTTIQVLNLLAVLLLTTLLFYFSIKQQALDLTPFSNLLRIVTSTWQKSLLFSPLSELKESIIWFVKNVNGETSSRTNAIIRGVLITIPVIVMFVMLMSVADRIFSDSLNQFFESIFPNGIKLTETILTFLVLTWVVLGIYAASPDVSIENDDELDDQNELQKSKELLGRFGIIEATILLSSCVVLFGFFVVIQFRYLFSGNVDLVGMSYSQYARRGFFELVTIAVLVLFVITILRRLTRYQRKSSHERLFQALATLLVLLTLIVLGSAWRRMGLYEHEFGFTHLRLYVQVFMVWLSVLLVIFVVDLFHVRKNIFSFGILLCAIGCLATLNILNTDQFIAERNVDRYLDGEELDICYLGRFSVDALPAMQKLHDRLEAYDEPISNTWRWFDQQYWSVIRSQESIWNFNLSRHWAYEYMNSFADTLSEREWDSLLYSCRLHLSLIDR